MAAPSPAIPRNGKRSEHRSACPGFAPATDARDDAQTKFIYPCKTPERFKINPLLMRTQVRARRGGKPGDGSIFRKTARLSQRAISLYSRLHHYRRFQRACQGKKKRKKRPSREKSAKAGNNLCRDGILRLCSGMEHVFGLGHMEFAALVVKHLFGRGFQLLGMAQAVFHHGEQLGIYHLRTTLPPASTV